VENFLGGLELAAKESTPGDFSKINSTALTRILIELEEHHLKLLIKGLGGAPNQDQIAVFNVLAFVLDVPDLSKKTEWYALARKQAQDYYSQIVLPDGTSFEQAINYNKGTPGFYLTLHDLHLPDKVPWVEALRPTAALSARYLFGMLRNGSHPGAYPRMGNDDRNNEPQLRVLMEKFPECADFQRIVNQVFEHGTEPVPSFTSVAFPYSGYYILRDGWKKEDAYLFLKACPRGRGHSRQDNTSLTLADFGQDLLVDCGSPSYGANPIDGFLAESWSKNTIQIDGSGQNKGAIGDKANRGPEANAAHPLSNRFYTSENLDFAEGFFNYGYKDPTILVKHQRQVISLRHCGFWIVTDRLTGESAPMPANETHAYTQVWNFDEAFAQDQIEAFPERKMIATGSPTGVNLCLRFCGDLPLTFKKWCGYIGSNKTYRGWVKPGPTDGKPNGNVAVAMDVNWTGKGPQQLVTVIDAQKGNMSTVKDYQCFQEGPVNGFDATLEDGTQISYRTSLLPSALKTPHVQVTGENLLVLRSPDRQSLNGLALGATAMELGQKKVNQPNAAFTLIHGNVTKIEEITYGKSE